MLTFWGSHHHTAPSPPAGVSRSLMSRPVCAPELSRLESVLCALQNQRSTANSSPGSIAHVAVGRERERDRRSVHSTSSTKCRRRSTSPARGATPEAPRSLRTRYARYSHRNRYRRTGVSAPGTDRCTGRCVPLLNPVIFRGGHMTYSVPCQWTYLPTSTVSHVSSVIVPQ